MSIKHAAILVDELVFIGKRHHNIFRTLDECGYSALDFQKYPQGFVTDGGTFVDRQQAAKIALDCGQITELSWSDTELFSEDLY